MAYWLALLLSLSIVPKLITDLQQPSSPLRDIKFDSSRLLVPEHLARLVPDSAFKTVPGLLHPACSPNVAYFGIGYFVKPGEWCTRMEPEYFFENQKTAVVFVPKFWSAWCVLNLVIIFLNCLLQVVNLF
jgi:hypothetical protein